MKIVRKLLIFAVLCPMLVFLVLPLLPSVAGGDGVADAAVTTSQEMRGLWVSSVINLDYPSSPTTSAAELKKQADTILDKAEELGFNAVFLQVRPCSDALYSSEIYPWSVYLTGTQGKAPSDSFDPLAYWVSEAHKRGLELHAWINPYRITRAASEWAALSADSPAKLHPEWTVQYKNNYYFNPGLPEVRQLVIDGALEIVNNYDVDGIHLDDYFYPGTDFDDAATYAEYGADFADIGDWRRDNVNQLVQGLDAALHKADKNIQFGISPAGIWASKTLNAAGSDTTSTYSSYYSNYADSKTWVEKGWVDYIAPQIYWEAGHSTADFTALLDWWTKLVDGTGVKLYVGVADYKTVEAKASDSPWYDGAEISRQLATCASNKLVSGVIHFRYGSIKSSPALQRVISAAYAEGTSNDTTTSGTISCPASTTVSTNTGSGGVSVFVDGTQLSFDQQPYVQSGRVMLPMRVIFEALGATVDYKSGKITAQKADITVRLELGSNKMQVNSDTKTLDVAAFATNGRTLLPLRAVSEALNCKVDWDNTTKTVTISTAAAE
jgi:uncharacterized lipoprotein YddW (UPF0748 family)